MTQHSFYHDLVIRIDCISLFVQDAQNSINDLNGKEI